MYGIIYPPDDPEEYDIWREQLHQWRHSTRYLMRYDGSLYDKPEFSWIARTFALGFVMMSDLEFYEPERGCYTLDALLDRAQEEFGGCDAIILWHAYPRIGFDARNQFDFYRDTLGGLDGLRALVDRCHERGVRVYLDYNPWDTGTRREGISDVDALISLIKQVDADAIFLDTLSNAAEDLRARLDETRPGVSLESENLVPLEHLPTHPSSWAQALPEGRLPGVLRNKWFERRHMQHRIKRWQRDHTEELHLAWMNGTGIVIWENVFGTLVPWSARDRSILRSMLPIQRRYADLFSGEGWTPLIPTAHLDLCASEWRGDDIRLWTICNRADRTYTGDLLEVDAAADTQFYDLIRGEQLSPTMQNGHVTLQTALRPRGIGAVISLSSSLVDDSFRDFLENQRQLDARADFDPSPPVRIETLKPPPPARVYAPTEIPADMVLIPGRQFDLRVQFTLRECGFYHVEGAPALNLRFRNLHRPAALTRPVDVPAFALDLTPVTNAQFAAFLQATGYQPRQREHFLDHWPDGILPTALELHPVVYVDLDDARAYARWAGKRLPTEEEWQHAAQGFEERLYPWGETFDPSRCNNGALGGTTSVTHFPQGRSPFGCYDMCGNVWEMTESERSDGRVRFCVLKGGSYYRAAGSEWYADGGPQPNTFSAKFILSWPALDRCATIGFRCAAEVKW